MSDGNLQTKTPHLGRCTLNYEVRGGSGHAAILGAQQLAYATALFRRKLATMRFDTQACQGAVLPALTKPLVHAQRIGYREFGN
jgi:hypothetical protein